MSLNSNYLNRISEILTLNKLNSGNKSYNSINNYYKTKEVPKKGINLSKFIIENNILNIKYYKKIKLLNNIRNINISSFNDTNIKAFLSFLNLNNKLNGNIYIVCHQKIMLDFLKLVLGISTITSSVNKIISHQNVWTFNLINSNTKVFITRHALTNDNVYAKHKDLIKKELKSKYNNTELFDKFESIFEREISNIAKNNNILNIENIDKNINKNNGLNIENKKLIKKLSIYCKKRLGEIDTKLTLYGIITSLLHSKNMPIITDNITTYDNIYVSPLVRTWLTALCIYLPNYSGNNMTLIVSPFIIERSKYPGSKPENYNNQIKTILKYLNYIKKIYNGKISLNNIHNLDEEIKNDLLNAVINIFNYFNKGNILSIIHFIDTPNSSLLFKKINILLLSENNEFIYNIEENTNNPFKVSNNTNNSSEVSNKTYNEDFIINELKIYSGISVPNRLTELHNLNVEPLAKIINNN